MGVWIVSDMSNAHGKTVRLTLLGVYFKADHGPSKYDNVCSIANLTRSIIDDQHHL